MKEIQLENYIKLFLLFFIFTNLIPIVNNDILRNLDYTHALSLNNGNTFILHKNGVIVYNYDLTVILYNCNFGGIPLISSEIDNSFTSLIQCDSNYTQYVVAIINTKIYIFSSRGEY